MMKSSSSTLVNTMRIAHLKPQKNQQLYLNKWGLLQKPVKKYLFRLLNNSKERTKSEAVTNSPFTININYLILSRLFYLSPSGQEKEKKKEKRISTLASNMIPMQNE